MKWHLSTQSLHYFPWSPCSYWKVSTSAQHSKRTITILKLVYLKKLAIMEIELYDEVIKIVDNLESRV